jgi:hypothetical protein
MLFSWVPPLLLALFGKYAMKRQIKPRVFGPSDVIYPTPTTGPDREPVEIPPTVDSVSWDQFELVTAELYRRLFVSTREYTRDCRAFAEGKPIELLGRADIDRLVQAAPSKGVRLEGR